MKDKKHKIHAVASIKWRSSTEIGREMPPPNSTRFAALARFVEDNEVSHFSIVLYYSKLINKRQNSFQYQEANLHFLAPKLVLPKLAIGSQLYVTDGFKILADVEIIEINK